MFGKRRKREELEPPPMAGDPGALEILRVWAAPGKPQQLALLTSWKDPGAWGLLMADIARHAAEAYASEGHDRAEALQRIHEIFEAEWNSPTDDPSGGA